MPATQPPEHTAPPVHGHAIFVLADGGVLTYELPVGAQDTAEIEFSVDTVTAENRSFGDIRTPKVISKDVTLTFRVSYQGDMGREPSGCYRTSAYSAAPPTGGIPGRQVPPHMIDMLAGNLAGPPAEAMLPGSPPWMQAVRGTAELLAQRIWDEAMIAGITYAEQMGMFRPRYMLGAAPGERSAGPRPGPQVFSMPLFTGSGDPTWVPRMCASEDCGRVVETIVADETWSGGPGRRPVIAQPCGHTMWVHDPVTGTLS